MASLSELTGIPGSQSSSRRTSAGAATTPNSKFFRKIDQIKTQLLSPSLTSYFQCEINFPADFVAWVKNRSLNIDTTIKDLINLSCSDASLPGSSLMTNEITDDYTGVTERHAYRRQYDDRADFTFYVDGNNYNIIYIFDSWLSYITNENLTGDYSVKNPNFNYRINYPQSYRNDIYIHKFEKSMSGSVLTYRFYDAYPISISSMPVSYDSVSLLKCTVSFTYLRYVVEKSTHTTTPESGNRALFPERAEILGTPSIPTQNPTIPSFSEAINLNYGNFYQSSSYITNFSNTSLTDNFNTSFSGSSSNFAELPQGVGGASGQYTSLFNNGQPPSSASSQQTAGGVAGVPQPGGVIGVPQPGGVVGVPQPVPSVTTPLTGQTLPSTIIPGLGLQSTPAQLSQYTRYPLSAPYSGGINPSLLAPVPSLGGVLPGYGFINNGFQLNANEFGETSDVSTTTLTPRTPRTPSGRPPIIGNGIPITNPGGTEPPLW